MKGGELEPVFGWVRWVFFGPEHGLRSAWRVALFVSLYAAVFVAYNVGLWTVAGDWLAGGQSMRLIAVSGTYLFPTLFVTWVFARSLDSHPALNTAPGVSVSQDVGSGSSLSASVARKGLASVGLGGGVWCALRELSGGLALGVALIVSGVAGMAALGSVSFSWGEPSWSLIGWSLAFLLAASWEEVLFRGYVFQWLGRGVGWVASTVVFGLLFALAHLGNPDPSLIGVFTIGLASVMLSVAYLVTERLWLPIGLHWGWNIAQALLFDIPVSGLQDREQVVPAVWHTALRGPDWVTGGPFGVEGSLVGVGVVMVAIVLLGWGRLVCLKRPL